MTEPIAVHCDASGVWYSGSRERLIDAGLATRNMFPQYSEAWRGNGLRRTADEPLRSVQRSAGDRDKVTWGGCVDSSDV